MDFSNGSFFNHSLPCTFIGAEYLRGTLNTGPRGRRFPPVRNGTCEHDADGQEQRAEHGQGYLTVGADGDAPHGYAAVDFLHGGGQRAVQPFGGRRTRGGGGRPE